MPIRKDNTEKCELTRAIWRRGPNYRARSKKVLALFCYLPLVFSSWRQTCITFEILYHCVGHHLVGDALRGISHELLFSKH